MIGLFTTNDSFQFTSPFFPDPTASPASILETENIVAQSRLKRRFKSLQGPLGISSERLEDLLDWDIYLVRISAASFLLPPYVTPPTPSVERSHDLMVTMNNRLKKINSGIRIHTK